MNTPRCLYELPEFLIEYPYVNWAQDDVPEVSETRLFQSLTKERLNFINSKGKPCFVPLKDCLGGMKMVWNFYHDSFEISFMSEGRKLGGVKYSYILDKAEQTRLYQEMAS